MDTTQFYEEYRSLTPELKKAMEHYLRFLKSVMTPQKKNGNKKVRTSGLSKGKVKMTADFDAPLDDMKEYME